MKNRQAPKPDRSRTFTTTTLPSRKSATTAVPEGKSKGGKPKQKDFKSGVAEAGARTTPASGTRDSVSRHSPPRHLPSRDSASRDKAAEKTSDASFGGKFRAHSSSKNGGAEGSFKKRDYKARSSHTGSSETGSSHTGGGRPYTERPSTDHFNTGRPGTYRTGGDRKGGYKASGAKARADELSGDRVRHERARDERVSGGKTGEDKTGNFATSAVVGENSLRRPKTAGRKKTDLPAALQNRRVALLILQNVLRHKQSLSDCLDNEPALRQLEKRDRAFVHALVACCLRRLGQIDALISACLNKSSFLKAQTQDLLRLGTAQLIFLGVPAHAAVDTIVSIAGEETTTQPYKALINAVLRRLTREGTELVAAQDAEKLNTPGWLWLSWRQTYGVGIARAIAKAHLTEAQTDITLKENAADYAVKCNATLLPSGSVRLSEGDITALPGFNEGAFWVQDAAAALPARLLGNVRGKKVLDLCAAPGGKTAQLAAMGADVTAVDKSDKRIVRLKENLARLNLNVTTHSADALTYRHPPVPFILLDAPCSATGTIRRHPDVAHLKLPEDVERLAELQGRLLRNAALHLMAPGGIMVYAVCSLQPEETEAQIAALLKTYPFLSRKPITAEETGDASFITPEGDLRCLPSHWPALGGIDGFYAARLYKAD